MNAGKFWLLMFLSLVIAILIFLEIACENQVASLTSTVGLNEARISQARQQNEMLRQLIQRIAIESQRDPALVDLLTKRGIHFRGPIPNASGPTSNSLPSPATVQPSTPTSPSP